jgi:hypothetical protein
MQKFARMGGKTMTQTLHGRIECGQIVLDQPLVLPDGMNVVVTVSDAACPPATMSDEEFGALLANPIWKDRQDMADSAAWVRKEREKWHQRPFRQD